MGKLNKTTERDSFERYVAEGLSTREAALRVGVAPSTGYSWRLGMRGKALKKPQFARLYAQSQAPSRIELEVSGVVIRIEGGFDQEVLGKLLTVVRGAS